MFTVSATSISLIISTFAQYLVLHKKKMRIFNKSLKCIYPFYHHHHNFQLFLEKVQVVNEVPPSPSIIDKGTNSPSSISLCLGFCDDGHSIVVLYLPTLRLPCTGSIPILSSLPLKGDPIDSQLPYLSSHWLLRISRRQRLAKT